MRVHTGRLENTWRRHTNTYTPINPYTPTLEQEHKHKHTHRHVHIASMCRVGKDSGKGLEKQTERAD